MKREGFFAAAVRSRAPAWDRDKTTSTKRKRVSPTPMRVVRHSAGVRTHPDGFSASTVFPVVTEDKAPPGNEKPHIFPVKILHGVARRGHTCQPGVERSATPGCGPPRPICPNWAIASGGPEFGLEFFGPFDIIKVWHSEISCPGIGSFTIRRSSANTPAPGHARSIPHHTANCTPTRWTNTGPSKKFTTTARSRCGPDAASRWS